MIVRRRQQVSLSWITFKSKHTFHIVEPCVQFSSPTPNPAHSLPLHIAPHVDTDSSHAGGLSYPDSPMMLNAPPRNTFKSHDPVLNIAH